MRWWSALAPVTKAGILLVAGCGIFINAWNHGGSIFSPGAVYAYGFPCIYLRTQPVWSGEDWDRENLRVTFFASGLLLNVLASYVLLTATRHACEWFARRRKQQP